MTTAAGSCRPPTAAGPGVSKTDLKLIGDAEWALELLHGKWKVHLLVLLARGVHRHGQLLAHIPGTSKKVMTAALRVLEQDGLVMRRPAQQSSRVEYALTPLGWSASAPLVALADWAVAAVADRAAATSDQASGRGAAVPDRAAAPGTPLLRTANG